MSEPLWKVQPNTTETWLALASEDCPVSDEAVPGSWWKADIRWDGCIHFSHAGNAPFHPLYENREAAHACDDYIHICDLDEMIARLQALKVAAQDHFGKDWPNI